MLSKNMKTGTIKLRTETPDDLWHMEKILEKGDRVVATTTRRTTVKRGSEIIKGERKKVTIGIEVERVEMEAGHLRLRGRIFSGPDDIEQSSYHSIGVVPRMEVRIKKDKWRKDQLERIKRAQVREPVLFICVLDRDEASFGSLSESGLDMRGSVTAKKVVGREDRSEYYSEISKVLVQEQPRHDAILIAGPGFEKENLFNYMKGKFPGLTKSVKMENASSAGESGIREVIKTSADKVLLQTRVSKETSLVERLLSGISKDGLVAYGKEEVRKAALSGAVETLLVAEDFVRENEGLMDAVEKMKGEVVIISGSHEAGERFVYLGGIAAFLRFKFS